MKKIIAFLTVLTMVLVLCANLVIASADGEVTVKNYKELVKAVNEQKADKILISPKYKHGTKEIINLLVKDRNITIAAENGESAVIDGRVDIYGEDGRGTVTFENVSINASQDSGIGLWVGHGPEVIIDSIHGGDSKTSQGGPGAVVIAADLTVGSASGGDAVNGMGGDGILVQGDSRIEAREVKGGNCTNGVGGAGVVATGGATVTVTESVTGGDGAVCPGKALLIKPDCSADISGVRKDGEQLESKKAPDPEIISSYALLLNALRNGKKEIHLDRSYKGGIKFGFGDIPIYVEGDGKITISGAYNDKLQKIDLGLCVCGGDWEISGLDIQTKNEGLTVLGGAHVVFNGNVTSSSAVHPPLGVIGGSTVEATGNFTATNAMCAVYMDDGTLTVKGTVMETGKHNAIYIDGGKMKMEGTVIQKSNVYDAIYLRGGELELKGTIKAMYPYYTEEGATITVSD